LESSLLLDSTFVSFGLVLGLGLAPLALSAAPFELALICLMCGIANSAFATIVYPDFGSTAGMILVGDSAQAGNEGGASAHNQHSYLEGFIRK